jgi:GntR family transcriptional regulator
MIAFRLDPKSGVPFYRQVIDQILAGLASGSLEAGERLPTVRQLAVDLAVNPNTVVKAYKELEIRGVLATQQGTGTFVGAKEISITEVERRRRLDQLLDEFTARAGSLGLTVEDLTQGLAERRSATGGASD